MNFENLIKNFARNIDISGNIEPDKEGGYAFVVDHFEVKCLPYGSKKGLLKGNICFLSDDQIESEELIKKLLKINLASAKENSEIITKEKDNFLVLFRLFDADNIGDEEFIQMFENFVNRLEFWRNCSAKQTFEPAMFQFIYP
jgi:hypothetical protein